MARRIDLGGKSKREYELVLYLTKEENDLLEKKVARSGLSLPVYCRSKLLGQTVKKKK